MCTPACLLSLVTFAQPAPSPPEPPPAYEGHTLVWHDEFDTDGPPDPAHWVYETGLVRNHEAQSYQAANVAVKGGLLTIEARREEMPNPRFDPAAADWDWQRTRKASGYTSGSVKTMGKHAWTFGRFEMRGRIDIRPGLWPAFWTVGSGTATAPAREWPSCGEIDIMEYYRGTLLANAAWASPKRWSAVWDDTKHPIADIAKAAGFESPEAWAAGFHTWRLDWTENEIRISVDGALLNTIDLTKAVNETPAAPGAAGGGVCPFHEPHHIILNLAVGGTSGGDPAATAFPGKFEVDWVRVYQRTPSPDAPKGTPERTPAVK